MMEYEGLKGCGYVLMLQGSEGKEAIALLARVSGNQATTSFQNQAFISALHDCIAMLGGRGI